MKILVLDIPIITQAIKRMNECCSKTKKKKQSHILPVIFEPENLGKLNVIETHLMTVKRVKYSIGLISEVKTTTMF